MVERIDPEHIVAGAFFAQLAIVAITALGAFILVHGERSMSFYKKRIAWPYFGYIIVLAVVTIALLVFSDRFSAEWARLLRSGSPPTVPWQIAVRIVLALDLIVIARLVYKSGGSWGSYFSPLYFMMPTLAVFLRQSLAVVAVYVICAAVLFSWTLLSYKSDYATSDSEGGRLGNHITLAYWAVSMFCFLFASFLGWFMQPTN